MTPDTFQRAAIIALAWCLVGIGFDADTDARRAPAQVSEFATNERPVEQPSSPALNAQIDRD